MPDEISDLELGQTVRSFAAGQKVFRRYELLRILGRGGMGVVWLARDDELEHEVAIKFLPEFVALDDQAIADLKRETRRSLELHHHHIVRIHQFETDERIAGISMEYVDGATLSSIKAKSENGCLSVEQTQPWIEQLCEALAYAHTRARIVHRDLKPANLMVNSRSEIKVTDFGIARSIADSVSRVSVVRQTGGTLVYMSPQQLDGERASHLDDIYSIGATLYELLTSKPPFYSGQVDRQIREKSPVPMAVRRTELSISNADAIPREWEETVVACLAKEPALRPQSAGEVAERLGIVAPNIIRAKLPPATSFQGGKEKDSGSRARMRLIVVAAILVISGLVITVWYSRSHPQVRAPQTEVRAQATISPIPAETARPAAADSSLTVVTRPPGAVLTVDASEIGTTPVTGVKLAPGHHNISLLRVGFEPIERTVEAGAGHTVDLSDLVLTRSTGTLQIASDPKAQDYEVTLTESPVPGEKLAATEIQGALAGLTPAALRNLPTGVYQVTIKRRGHKPQIQSVTVSREKSATASAEFGPATIETTPSPAQIQPTSTAAISILKGALQESDMPGFFRKKMQGKDAFISGGVEQGGKQYYLVSIGYDEMVYEVTADTERIIASGSIADGTFVLEKMSDQELALKLCIRKLETRIAREGRTEVKSNLESPYSGTTSLDERAAKALGFTLSIKKRKK